MLTINLLVKAYRELELIARNAKAANDTRTYMLALNEMGKISAQVNEQAAA